MNEGKKEEEEDKKHLNPPDLPSFNVTFNIQQLPSVKILDELNGEGGITFIHHWMVLYACNVPAADHQMII